MTFQTSDDLIIKKVLITNNLFWPMKIYSFFRLQKYRRSKHMILTSQLVRNGQKLKLLDYILWYHKGYKEFNCDFIKRLAQLCIMQSWMGCCKLLNLISYARLFSNLVSAHNSLLFSVFSKAIKWILSKICNGYYSLQ